MIRPDAIPILEAASQVALPPTLLADLFGSGYRPKGSERVRLVAAGRAEVSVPLTQSGEMRVVLDALDREVLGDPPLRVCGPRGHAPVLTIEPVRRTLVLPAALRRAWAVPSVVTVVAGSVALGRVAVIEGTAAGVHLEKVDRLAAGLKVGDTVRWQRDLDLGESTGTVSTDPRVRPTGRLITETDVRQARLRGQKIVVQPGQLMTPAAKSLARELGVIDALPGSSPRS